MLEVLRAISGPESRQIRNTFAQIFQRKTFGKYSRRGHMLNETQNSFAEYSCKYFLVSPCGLVRR